MGLSFAGNSCTLITGDESGAIKLWSTIAGSHKVAASAHEGWVTSLAASCDGKTLGRGENDALIKIWGLAELFKEGY